MVVRYRLTDAANTAVIPVWVERNPGAAASRVTSLKVWASFDDGATWRAAPVAGGVVVVKPPGDARFVSLRASAADADGNAVTQTIVRAYRLG